MSEQDKEAEGTVVPRASGVSASVCYGNGTPMNPERRTSGEGAAYSAATSTATTQTAASVAPSTQQTHQHVNRDRYRRLDGLLSWQSQDVRFLVGQQSVVQR